ncbi:hypothetical protein EVAR_28008_1 [Eumeta japonica]|uniref:Uncharacterized protein n=1 Tax=Eumeta variegata TaxID=151549 RepID=A0A4C1WDS8_EUMVA|nr:hypothetical protein EVAR_28008_1 [Eumeta japonica]
MNARKLSVAVDRLRKASVDMISAVWYITTCLPEVFTAVKSKRPNTGLQELHHNTFAHPALKTRDFMNKKF